MTVFDRVENSGDESDRYGISVPVIGFVRTSNSADGVAFAVRPWEQVPREIRRVAPWMRNPRPAANAPRRYDEALKDLEMGFRRQTCQTVDGNHVLRAGGHHDDAVDLRPEDDMVAGTGNGRLEPQVSISIPGNVHEEIQR